MRRVRSKDGTPIAYEHSGNGPPLVLIHGAANDHTRWTSLLPELGKYFTVYTIDRRGRGESGDAEAYAIEREYEDVVAVVETLPHPVNLIGHSYGAICCLEASLKTSNLQKLILYEPPIPTDNKGKSSADGLNRMKSCLAKKKTEEALLIFLQEIVGVEEDEVAKLKSLSSWNVRINAAHTIPREEESVVSYTLHPERFSQMKTPTLLLLGGNSPLFFRAATETLIKSIPSSRLGIIPGQGHSAMDTAPELFLREVIGFLTAECFI
jgi:pimeloyl-ACP methyl ester carboxylesterase